MPYEQPGSRAEQARASATARRMAISEALGALTVGAAHKSLAYEPTTDHLDRAKQILRTEKAVVVSNAF